jgi:hypothetical protein
LAVIAIVALATYLKALEELGRIPLIARLHSKIQWARPHGIDLYLIPELDFAVFSNHDSGRGEWNLGVRRNQSAGIRITAR